jgi:hypothetical protein
VSLCLQPPRRVVTALCLPELIDASVVDGALALEVNPVPYVLSENVRRPEGRNLVPPAFAFSRLIFSGTRLVLAP